MKQRNWTILKKIIYLKKYIYIFISKNQINKNKYIICKY